MQPHDEARIPLALADGYVNPSKTWSASRSFRCKKNADTTLIFKDGRFYTKENTVEAQFTTDSYPKFLGQVNDRIKKVDGGWLYKTSWSPNPLKATNYRGFWVKYGEQDFNYLEIGTPSADAYIVVDKNDNKIGTLNEYFAHIVQNLRG